MYIPQSLFMGFYGVNKIHIPEHKKTILTELQTHYITEFIYNDKMAFSHCEHILKRYIIWTT